MKGKGETWRGDGVNTDSRWRRERRKDELKGRGRGTWRGDGLNTDNRWGRGGGKMR